MRKVGLWGRGAWAAAALAAGLATLSGAPAAETPAAVDWLTGPGLQKQLARPIDVSWSHNPLRRAIERLSRARRVAVLIDRRVDPGQKVALQLRNVPLAAVLREIARTRQLGVSLLGPVAYFGPPQVSSRLRTIAAVRTEEIRRLPLSVKRKFLLPKRLAWDDFATPRRLLGKLAEQNGLAIVGLDRVPHDLWAAADLPPLSLVDRLTLVLVQFDLTFQLGRDGNTLTLVPLPDEVALVRSYPGGREPQATAAKYASLVPKAQVKVVGDRVYVKGLLEAHERLANPPRRLPRGPSKPAHRHQGADRFTGKVAGQLDQLLTGLAARFQLELRIDHRALNQAGISLQQYVSTAVENVTVDELFGEVLKPAGLTFRRRGNVVEVFPAE